MNKIEINAIMFTSYDDDSRWVEYTFNNGNENMLGYELLEGKEIGLEDEEILKMLNDDQDKYTNKIYIDSVSEHLRDWIENCRMSDNDMWFVESDDLLSEIGSEEEVKRFMECMEEEYADIEELKGYIEFDYNDLEITIYGGIITKFLF